MPHEQRVIVRRDRQGNVIRVTTIHSPALPSRAPGSPTAPSAPTARRTLVEEVSAADLPRLLQELEKPRPVK